MEKTQKNILELKKEPIIIDIIIKELKKEPIIIDIIIKELKKEPIIIDIIIKDWLLKLKKKFKIKNLIWKLNLIVMILAKIKLHGVKITKIIALNNGLNLM